jgi:hypothetical protein
MPIFYLLLFYNLTKIKDTILQPKINRKKSVAKLEFKDTQRSSKYLLTHQQQDEYGEIKTNLIKVIFL